MTLKEIIDQVKQLSLSDKVRLIEQVTPQIKRELRVLGLVTPRKSLRGIWRGLNITEDDINQARSEMWANFPREDF
ncbi:MAG TPA: hypothetical protein DDW76_00160 [Cyanobacteria bacterium UBA11369]|nr:hypothetical protein [Cyanobacteria bacterium UBA11371]HBE36331.1 hypothetical protein [Cyanobacteria bacterium UBA11368]HBE47255.1 hypothetical protein [Cyanobacteria bacterium UBA11369]